jgi:hypothetical protein
VTVAAGTGGHGNATGTPDRQPALVDGLRYRSYVIRVWVADPADTPRTRMRIERIATGTEVEVRGTPAADLAARLERILDPDPSDDRQTGGRVGVSNRGRN